MEGSPRIVFFGTPEFAVASLQAILQAEFNVGAVVTVPDKPVGRGLKLSSSPVKQFALSRGIQVFQPDSLNDQEFLTQLACLKADLFVVVAFRILPPVIWRMPSLGTFNLHASLLPQYRGASPIHWAIINGESETGITTFFINDRVDTGEIIFQERVAIPNDETAGALHDRLMIFGAELVVKTLNQILQGKVSRISQEILLTGNTLLKPAPKLQKHHLRIDWDTNILCVYNHIRGLSPYPGAVTEIAKVDGTNLMMRILAASAEPFPEREILRPGTVITDRKRFLKVFARDGLISVSILQPESGRSMNIRDFLNGYGKLLA